MTSELLSISVIGAVMNGTVPPDPNVPKNERHTLPYLMPSIYHEALDLYKKIKNNELLNEVNPTDCIYLFIYLLNLLI